MTFETSPTSEFGYSYAAWYADVSHEVKPVTSGYRLVLTYNLIHHESAEQLSLNDDTSASLLSVFAYWKALYKDSYPSMMVIEDSVVPWLPGLDAVQKCPTSLLFVLDHKYPSADLSFAHLKDVDQARVEELRKACEVKGFYLYLASIEKTVSGSVEDDYYGGYNSGYTADCNHPIVDVCESSLCLLRVVDRKGRTVAEKVDIDETISVQGDVFDLIARRTRRTLNKAIQETKDLVLPTSKRQLH